MGKFLAPFSFLWHLCFSLIPHILIHFLSSPPWATRGPNRIPLWGHILLDSLPLSAFLWPHHCVRPSHKIAVAVVCACPYSCSTSNLFPTMQSNCSFIGDVGSWPKILEWLLSNILVKTKLLSVAFKHLYELTPAYFLSLGSSHFSFHPKDIHACTCAHIHTCAHEHMQQLYDLHRSRASCSLLA